MASDAIIAGVLRKLAEGEASASDTVSRPAAPAPQTVPASVEKLWRPQLHDLDDSRDSAPGNARPTEFWTIPGFGWNTRVTTSFGDLPVQALRVRDPVRTSRGNFVQVQWIDEIKLDEGFLDGFPDAHPVTIAAGSLGKGLPKADMTVSPHQRVAVGENGFHSEFRMARDLLGRPGVLRSPQFPLRYYLFHCGEPAQVMIEGVWVTVAP